MSNRFWTQWRKVLGIIGGSQEDYPISNGDLRRGLVPLALPDEGERIAGGETLIESELKIVAPRPSGQIPGSAVHG